ncbi:related to putative glutathione S-transferase [Ramularia collo-cygni]|uniref:Related to putative glutathione S-transferase n=1 Tax=Ramularia collo-cygni TaxID=112498 RepID=A0A2D3V8Q8_9PEZI|nr:related to putative glutathione S-transferase [Ramularia collo-cygni]CZT21157.1 related to putative glutathione S-transferase [Ramularia collo-cygni]
MSHDITFFDLPSKGKSACWSLNPWKARLVLNYKNLPYKTQWIEYPDVAPTFKSYGIPANSPELNPNAEYSIPAAQINGQYIMDSLSIAHTLEDLQPEPSLHLNSEYVGRTQEAILKLWGQLAPIAMHRIPDMLLNPCSAQYFQETRTKRFGMSLAEFAKSDKAENAWPGAQPILEEIKTILHENSGGPYVLGNKPSFADFILAGWWRFTELLDNDGDLHGRIMQFDDGFLEHYDACKKWMERVD